MTTPLAAFRLEKKRYASAACRLQQASVATYVVYVPPVGSTANIILTILLRYNAALICPLAYAQVFEVLGPTGAFIPHRQYNIPSRDFGDAAHGGR